MHFAHELDNMDSYRSSLGLTLPSSWGAGRPFVQGKDEDACGSSSIQLKCPPQYKYIPQVQTLCNITERVLSPSSDTTQLRPSNLFTIPPQFLKRLLFAVVSTAWQ